MHKKPEVQCGTSGRSLELIQLFTYSNLVRGKSWVAAKPN